MEIGYLLSAWLLTAASFVTVPVPKPCEVSTFTQTQADDWFRWDQPTTAGVARWWEVLTPGTSAWVRADRQEHLIGQLPASGEVWVRACNNAGCSVPAALWWDIHSFRMLDDTNRDNGHCKATGKRLRRAPPDCVSPMCEGP